MKKIVQQIIAYVLLVCFFGTLVPAGQFHLHEEEAHCDANDLIAESDPCHVSIYHRNSNEHHCEHQSHFIDTHDDCEFCKILSNKRTQFTTNSNLIVTPTISDNILADSGSLILHWNCSFSNPGRAPPIA